MSGPHLGTGAGRHASISPSPHPVAPAAVGAGLFLPASAEVPEPSYHSFRSLQQQQQEQQQQLLPAHVQPRMTARTIDRYLQATRVERPN